VAETWPKTNNQPAGKAKLDVPVIREFREASVAACVVPVFKDDKGRYQAVVGIAGDHYYPESRQREHRMKAEYVAFGGYLDLEKTPGSTSIPPRAGKPEDPQEGALREMEEELRNNTGKPILPRIDPKRLVPMDARTLTKPTGERVAVVGFMLKLEPQEVAAVQSHVERIKDLSYHREVREHTKNTGTQKPEICAPSILPLTELAVETGRHKLHQPGTVSLFQNISTSLMKEDRSTSTGARESLLQRLEQFSGEPRRFIR
jgi:hypothetical protein